VGSAGSSPEASPGAGARLDAEGLVERGRRLAGLATGEIVEDRGQVTLGEATRGGRLGERDLDPLASDERREQNATQAAARSAKLR